MEDIALCLEVTKIRPLKPLDWLDVAENLNEALTREDRDVSLKG